jgi:hypothetical protein
MSRDNSWGLDSPILCLNSAFSSFGATSAAKFLSAIFGFWT